MRASAKILRAVHERMREMAKSGMSLLEMDAVAEDLIRTAGATPSFKGFHGFPASLCTMINEQVVHGIPSDYVLRDGDLLSLDCGVHFKGFHSDAAFSLVIGGAEANSRSEKFQKEVKNALKKGCAAAKAGNKMSEIGKAVENYINQTPYSIIKEYTGHGIGKNMHEDPHVYNYFRKEDDLILKEGMTICIEPIIAEKKPKCLTLKDNWTVITADGADACQWEHCGVITKNGLEIFA